MLSGYGLIVSERLLKTGTNDKGERLGFVPYDGGVVVALGGNFIFAEAGRYVWREGTIVPGCQDGEPSQPDEHRMVEIRRSRIPEEKREEVSAALEKSGFHRPFVYWP